MNLDLVRRVAQTWWPLAPALAVFAVQLWRVVAAAHRFTGELVYALDDAYIHLSIARNLVDNGVLGINAGHFSPATSSLGWTALLAGSMIPAGPADWLPLAWGIVGAVAVLATTNVFLLRVTPTGAPARALILLAVVVGVPLSAQVLVGMEHLAHAAAILSLLGLGALVVERATATRVVATAVVAALAVSFRYEALFVVVPLAAVLAARRSWVAVATLVASSALFPTAYGLLAVANGWPFLPTGIVTKTAAQHGWTAWPGHLASSVVGNAAQGPAATALVVLAVAVLVFRRRELGPRGRTLVGAWLAAVVTHLVFARTGQLFRYDAWIVATGIPIIAVPLVARGSRIDVPWVVAPAVALTVGIRAFTADYRTAMSAVALSRHQVPIARFYARTPGTLVASPEAGVLTWVGRVQLVDLAGLATLEVARLGRDGRWNPRNLERIVADSGAETVALFPHFRARGAATDLPPTWVHVADLVEGSSPPGTEQLKLYGVGERNARRLEGELRAWSSALPRPMRFRYPTPPRVDDP